MEKENKNKITGVIEGSITTFLAKKRIVTNPALEGEAEVIPNEGTVMLKEKGSNSHFGILSDNLNPEMVAAGYKTADQIRAYTKNFENVKENRVYSTGGGVVFIEFTTGKPKVEEKAAFSGLKKEEKEKLKDRIKWLKEKAGVTEVGLNSFLDLVKDNIEDLEPFNPRFVPIEREVERALTSASLNFNLMLVGPAASGKNVFIDTFANLIGRTVIDKGCSAETTGEALFGHLALKEPEKIDKEALKKAGEELLSVLKGEKDPKGVDVTSLFVTMGGSNPVIDFSPSEITKGLREKVIINLDEANTLNPSVTSLFHGFLDTRRKGQIEMYEEVALHEKCLMTGTMNEGYLGTNPMNYAFSSRWTFVDFNLPAEIAEIVKSEVKFNNRKIDDFSLSQINAVYKKHKNMVQEGAIPELNIRAYVRAGLLCSLGIKAPTAIRDEVVGGERDPEYKLALDTAVKITC